MMIILKYIYKSVDLKKPTVNLEEFLVFLRNFEPTNDSDIRALSFKKMQDIKKMLKFVPPVHQSFYLNLPHKNRRGENESQDALPALRDDRQDDNN